MKDNQMTEVKKSEEAAELLFTYIGKKYKLVFFSKASLNDKLEIDVSLIDDTYCILIDKEFFNKTLKDNQNALAELEKVISYNRGITGYFYYGVWYLFFLWIFHSYPNIIGGYLLYNLPFYLQIIGIIFIYGLTLLLPLFLMFKEINNKINNVPSGKLMLHYLKDEKYQNMMVQFRKTNNLKKKWWENPIIMRQISPFHNLGKKVIFGYSLLIIFLLTLLASFYLTVDVPFSYLPKLYQEKTLLDYSNTDIIKTKYQFIEKTTSLNLPLNLEVCGNYFCNRFDNLIYDNDFNLIDLNNYLEDGESFSQILTINDGIIVFNYCKEEGNERSYKVVNLETNTIIVQLDSTTLNLDVDFYIFMDAGVNNNEIYLSGELQDGTERSGYLVKIDKNGNLISYQSTDGLIISTITIYNDFLYLTEVSSQNDQNTVFKLLNLNLEVIDKKVVSNLRTIYSVVIDNKIFIRTLEKGMSNYYQLSTSLALEKEYSYISSANYIHATKKSFYSGITLKSFREFNNDFKIINKGLECFDCNNEEYFNEYYFIKNNDKLYALTNDYVLVFEETTNDNYSLSRSPLTNEGFMLFLAVYIIPMTIWASGVSRRNKETLITNKYFKELLNNNKT